MGWSEKYKKSIDCDNPKGFSQRAHCQGKKKKMSIREYKEPIKFSKFAHKTKHLGKTTHQLDPNLDLKHLVHHASVEFLDKDADGDVDIFDKLGIPDESPGKDYEKTSKQLIKKQKGEIEHSKRKIAYYEGTLHHWFKGSKSKDGKPGWVQADGSPCANEPGETKTPKCFSSARLKSLKKKGKKGESLIRSAVRRKRKKDKAQQRKTGGAAPTNVPTFAKGRKDPNYVKAEPGIKESMEIKEARKDKPSKGSGTKDACYHKVKSRYSVWPSAYASGALVKCRRVGADNWGTKSESTSSLSYDWDTPIRERADRYCPKCEKLELRSECKYGPKYWDMFSLPAEIVSSKKDFNITMPHPGNMPEGYDHEYSMARSELSTIISAAKRLRNKMKKGEGNIEAWVQSKITKAADYIDSAADYVDSGEMKEQVVGGSVKLKPGKGLGGGVLSYPEGGAPKKHGDKEPKLPRLQQAHYEPEGEVIDEKCWPGYKKKGMKTMFGKRYPNCVKAEEYSNWRSDFGLSEDWQSVNRKDKTDGLSPAAVKAYRRENPGSKLQTAVTEKSPKGKRAKRRASFCRRMSGMKSKLTSAKTARNPDSRINKALRRWNCN